MRKEFNITGLCVPGKHYMVDLGSRLEQMKKMVDQGQYFTINRRANMENHHIGSSGGVFKKRIYRGLPRLSDDRQCDVQQRGFFCAGFCSLFFG